MTHIRNRYIYHFWPYYENRKSIRLLQLERFVEIYRNTTRTGSWQPSVSWLACREITITAEGLTNKRFESPIKGGALVSFPDGDFRSCARTSNCRRKLPVMAKCQHTNCHTCCWILQDGKKHGLPCQLSRYLMFMFMKMFHFTNVRLLEGMLERANISENRNNSHIACKLDIGATLNVN